MQIIRCCFCLGVQTYDRHLLRWVGQFVLLAIFHQNPADSAGRCCKNAFRSPCVFFVPVTRRVQVPKQGILAQAKKQLPIYSAHYSCTWALSAKIKQPASASGRRQPPIALLVSSACADLEPLHKAAGAGSYSVSI